MCILTDVWFVQVKYITGSFHVLGMFLYLLQTIELLKQLWGSCLINQGLENESEEKVMLSLYTP